MTICSKCGESRPMDDRLAEIEGWEGPLCPTCGSCSPEFRLIIAGSRRFEDRELLDRTMASQLTRPTEIVSGTARGADTLGEEWAKANGIPVKRFPANWTRHGRAAGILRNEEMAEYADGLVAFWDGESPGTAHMIRIAKARGLKVRVVRFSKETPK